MQGEFFQLCQLGTEGRTYHKEEDARKVEDESIADYDGRIAIVVLVLESIYCIHIIIHVVLF